MYAEMKLKDMNYIVEQAGTLADALANILECISSGIKSEGCVVYVDCSNEVNFVSQEDAEEIIDCYGANCVYDKMGNSGFAVVYNSEDKVLVNGESYLLGDYLIMRVEKALLPLHSDDLDRVEQEYSSRLVPFVIGSDYTEVYMF